MEANVRKKIAVVGAGVAGIVCAYVLSRKHDVVLFEKDSRVGGHTNTVVIQDGPDQGLSIDTGFIVCNQRNYPNFYKFLQQLQVPLQDSDMSFSFHCEKTGFGYSGPTLRDFLRRPVNLLKRSFLRMLVEQQSFNRRSIRELDQKAFHDAPLGEYARHLRLSSFFIQNYLAPLTSAIWSSSDRSALEIPTGTFLTFFKNHGMLELRTIPQWQVVRGGSHSYIKAFRSRFRGRVELNTSVAEVRRQDGRILLQRQSGASEQFDAVVLASHADETLRLLKDPSARENALFGAWRYQENSAVLHTDARLLPPRRSLWSSWNYRRDAHASPESAVAVSYYMNRLQRLTTPVNYVVTLNRDTQIDPSKIIYKTTYSHPQYDSASVASQSEIKSLSGDRNTYYCGSYLGFGFHEDAVSSALDVTAKFGMTL